MDLYFASSNLSKVEEIQQLLPQNSFRLLSLIDLNFTVEIPETGDTLEENSRIKASFVYNRFGHSTFADDTGLEVKFLNGAPGVMTARFAGLQADSEQNIEKLLNDLRGTNDRRARFRTVITLIMDGTHVQFEGVVTGHISVEPKGEQGFGYDPVFVPDGYVNTFAEMSARDKNEISHRGKAIAHLVSFLKKHEN